MSEEIQQELPFLSCVRHHGEEHICIILNYDDKIMSYYDFNSIRTPEEKQHFLKLGDLWWYESNRLLPINIFLPYKMNVFRYCIRTVSIKEIEIVFGPATSLNNLLKKRVKKRQIQLVRHTPEHD